MAETHAVDVASARRIVELLDATWGSFVELLRTLDAPEWDLATDCPGWTVGDLAAHVIGVESIMTGRETPDVGDHPWPHVRNEVGRMMEPWVEHYRGRRPNEVIDDLVAITEERVAFFDALDDDGWAGETFTPVGPGTFADLVGFRLFDSWAHEQDARRAVGVPGNFDTEAGRWNVERCSQPLGRVVSRVAQAPDGSIVSWRAFGPPFEHRWTVEVVAGRGVIRPDLADPTVRIMCDVTTFVRLGLGRVAPDAAFGAGLVSLLGDVDLGRRVVESMNFAP